MYGNKSREQWSCSWRSVAIASWNCCRVVVNRAAGKAGSPRKAGDCCRLCVYCKHHSVSSRTVSSYYALEYRKTDTERMLKCYAFLTYPAPRISWVRGNTSIPETDRKEARDGVLYSLRSDQNIINTADPYYCHIHLPHEEWAAEWKMLDQLSNVEGSSIAIPCEYSSNTANSEGFSVVWTLNRNAVISVLASFNGTSHSYQPRVHINQSDFSLMLHDLAPNDSGEYLCNISTPHYTKLTVRTLQVENSGNTNEIVVGVMIGAAILVAVGVGVGVLFRKCRRKEEII
ncbi:HERV-H LTR-associating protein 2 isoform X4 [Chroicocephalus ridibundus]|uniref:HERV-H LTR-associating protein 2 isoform X4 n=1 Tax=Chroicocephalus ridibundus TaxID=1192867 RepID=UPI002FDCCD1D